MTAIQQVRLIAERTNTSAMVDALTGSTPTFFRGTDVEFAFGIFRDGALQSAAGLATVTLEVKRRDARTAAAVMSKTISSGVLTPDLTQAQWDTGAGAHGVIGFTAVETSIDLGTADEGVFHLVLSATTDDGKRVTLGISTINVVEDGTPTGENAPPLISDDYYTKAESDARYLAASDESAQNAAIASKIPLAQKGAPNGVPTLDADGRIPVGQLPVVGGTYIPVSARGAANGVPSLDGATKVPVAQLPTGTANGIASLDSTGKVPAAQLPAVPAGGPYIPASQKAAASGVASLDSTGKVPSSQLPPVVGGPFVPTSSVGVASGVASLDSGGKVPAAQLPGGFSLGADEGIIRVITLDAADPDVVATPAFKNYLWIRRQTSLVTNPPVSDQIKWWNEGDGGGIQRWQWIWEPTAIPPPLIDVVFAVAGNLTLSAWPAPGSSSGCIATYTINGSDPTINDPVGPLFPTRAVVNPTSGVSWTDGSGTHYRFVIKARAFAPGLPNSLLATRTVSVNADGSFYANF